MIQDLSWADCKIYLWVTTKGDVIFFARVQNEVARSHGGGEEKNTQIYHD